MVFTSNTFIFYFLPFALALYFAVPKSTRNLTLSLLSYLFYGWWEPWFCILLLFSSLVDYSCGRVISRDGASPSVRRRALFVSVATNLSLLATFKYLYFLTFNVSAVFGALGAGSFPVVELALPIGISFYTFQSMSYSIDLYRREAPPARSLVDFLCYVSLFPQLIAGPIVRYSSLAAQLAAREVTFDRFAQGVAFFVIGFAKKVFIANNLAEVADAAFGAATLPWHMAWVGVFAFAMQIYFDFSGYSDMAIGLGKMFGFDLPQNFNAPYRARSLSDFWRRWHISLSTWLRDYLYVSLGGNRAGPRRTQMNLMITMLLGGLWHGAEWQFVAWGFVHGLLLVVERIFREGEYHLRLPSSWQPLCTFILVLFTWVFFRADGLGHAMNYFSFMFGLAPAATDLSILAGIMYRPFSVAMLALAASIVWLAPQTHEMIHGGDRSPIRRTLFALAIIVLLLASIFEMSTQAYNPFLYFRF